MPPRRRLPTVGDVNDVYREAPMRPVPELFDPQTLVLVLSAALAAVTTVVVVGLGAEAALARLRTRRRARSTPAAAERA
jgi:hypothetical protein